MTSGHSSFGLQEFHKTSIDASVSKLKLDGPHDYLHGENSITQSGLYLTSQSYRYKVSTSSEALPRHRELLRHWT